AQGPRHERSGARSDRARSQGDRQGARRRRPQARLAGVRGQSAPRSRRRSARDARAEPGRARSPRGGPRICRRAITASRYHRSMRYAALALVVATACGDDTPTVTPNCTRTQGSTVSMRQIAYGCGRPNAPPAPGCMQGVVTLATSPPYDGRLFALEQAGKIRILDKEVLQPDAFLDITPDTGGPVIC